MFLDDHSPSVRKMCAVNHAQFFSTDQICLALMRRVMIQELACTRLVKPVGF